MDSLKSKLIQRGRVREGEREREAPDSHFTNWEEHKYAQVKGEREIRMETKRQSYCWWFDSHNSPNCSPWLQSTLQELDEKTKAMLKLIHEDADSFAQRAEMYYKKRPELISMVEDFYRTHRSLAERYEQLRVDPSTRVRSPLRHSFSHFPPKGGELEYVLSSVKSFDSESSFTEEAYNSEECAESEIDDPEQENPFRVGASYDELINLREELERLREDNEIQRIQIRQKDEQNEELINDLMNLREEIETIKVEYALTLTKRTSDMMNQEQQLKQIEDKKRHLKDELELKDEEKREVIRQLSLAMEMLREENRVLKKSNAMKNSPKKWSPPEIQMFKGVDLGKWFRFKCQSSIVPL